MERLESVALYEVFSFLDNVSETLNNVYVKFALLDFALHVAGYFGVLN